jgi:beta-lactamase class A
MSDAFAGEIAAIAEDAQLEAASVAVYDFVTSSAWDVDGDRWFHAASTVKVAILIALGAAVGEHRFELHSRLAVRNRFLSAADGAPFRIAASRDANAEVHQHIGRTMRLEELALHMIATSSNLATNLLLDLIGVEYVRTVLQRLDVEGVDVRRGVEDERAFEAGISNRATASGLVRLFRALHEERAATPQVTRWMLDVLSRQEFTGGIPAGLPDHVRPEATVANKTGEISNMAHDAGLVFLPDQTVYAVAVLTETPKGVAPRQAIVARLARVAYDRVMAGRAQAVADSSGATAGAGVRQDTR